MDRLEQAGFAAYAVGGCVRDLLRGVPPTDYDMTTSATPEEVKPQAAFVYTDDWADDLSDIQPPFEDEE